jgi:hypothetical protein
MTEMGQPKVLWQSGLTENFGRLLEARNKANSYATDGMLSVDLLLLAKLNNVCIRRLIQEDESKSSYNTVVCG